MANVRVRSNIVEDGPSFFIGKGEYPNMMAAINAAKLWISSQSNPSLYYNEVNTISFI
jgi:hypothetical protein